MLLQIHNRVGERGARGTNHSCGDGDADRMSPPPAPAPLARLARKYEVHRCLLGRGLGDDTHYTTSSQSDGDRGQIVIRRQAGGREELTTVNDSGAH